jgi:ribosome-binding protein aMBF1 (putative translation factor)
MEQKLTQQDLAGRLAAVNFAASEDVVRSIESGEREVTDKELKVLAKALRVRPELLLGQ